MKVGTAVLLCLTFLPILLILYVCVEVLLDTSNDLDRALRGEFTGVSTRSIPSAGLLKLGGKAAIYRRNRPGRQHAGRDDEKKLVKFLEQGEENLRHVNIGNSSHEKKATSVEERDTFPPFVATWDTDGPGEGGEAVNVNATLLSAEERARYDAGWRSNSFNQYVSDMISVHRRLPHAWSEHCRNKNFRTDLPEASVVIIFHNEAWTVLLRSVHSVLSRTPSHLLREVILVDDFSTMGHLKRPLDDYWKNTPKVKIVRAQKREGLTRARLLGYNTSTAPLLVFFDSHIECFPGWYEPLADRIVTDPRAAVYPSIEVIHGDTFRTVPNHDVQVKGLFRWRDLNFAFRFLSDEDRKSRSSPSDPIKSPVMPGGLFAIDRGFFTRLGTYDPGLDYWGGENIEISFKAWMCNGSVELIPCSHVGHIFRNSNPITWPTSVGQNNAARVAAVWMDDYANYFWESQLYNIGDYGDVSDRRRLRESLHCKSFDWFMKNVSQMKHTLVDATHAGELKSKASTLCVDSLGKKSYRPLLYPCHGLGGNQFWYITRDKQLLQDLRKICSKDETVIVLDENCRDTWNYTQDDHLINSSTGLCLEEREIAEKQEDVTLTLKPCVLDNPRQKWMITPRRTDINFPKISS